MSFFVCVACLCLFLFFFFFFNDTATTEIYTLSLHDALPIAPPRLLHLHHLGPEVGQLPGGQRAGRSEEHTSELQSQFHLVCRLLLEKKKHTPLTLLLQKKKKKECNR